MAWLRVKEFRPFGLLTAAEGKCWGSIRLSYERLYQGRSEGITERDAFALFAASSTGRPGRRR